VEIGNDQKNPARDFDLLQNYPNPFNSSTQIRFRLKKAEEIQLTIYDLHGKEICKLIDNFQLAGVQELSWDGRDQKGNVVPTGIYFYQLKAGNKLDNRKISLIR